MQVQKLDAAHFNSAPKLNRDAMLTTSGVKLELLQDIDHLSSFEEGIWGWNKWAGSSTPV